MIIFWFLTVSLFAMGIWWLATREVTNGARIRARVTARLEPALDELNQAYISGRIETSEYERRRKALEKL